MHVAGVRIGPAGNVASREDPGHARFEIGVDDDTTIKSKSRAFGEFDTWSHTDAGDHEIRLKHSTVLEFHLLAVDGICRVLEVENDSVLLVEIAHKVAHLWTQNAFHRPLVRRDYMDFDFAGAQRCRDLEADEAGAHHDRPARRFGAFNDRPAVGERTQSVNVRLISAGNRQSNRLGASREQQAVVRDSCYRQRARLRVNARRSW